MIRSVLFTAVACVASVGQAQTIFRISNVTITEKENVITGNGATAEIKGSEGSDRVVIHADQHMTIKARVKVSTQNVARSSLKSSAVNAIFEIDMILDGKKDNRRIEKIFYTDQERTTHLKEKFVTKQGNQVRVITVEFDGSLE